MEYDKPTLPVVPPLRSADDTSFEIYMKRDNVFMGGLMVLVGSLLVASLFFNSFYYYFSSIVMLLFPAIICFKILVDIVVTEKSEDGVVE